MQATETRATVRRLQATDVDRFHRFASASTLCSLIDPVRRQELLDHGVVIVAFVEREIVGCTCFETDVGRIYHGVAGDERALPRSSVYLCSTFVVSACRGSGIGDRLYTERLRCATALGREAIAVEILGCGVPLTIDLSASTGYRFHARAGFRVDGFSAEADHGPLMLKRST